MTETIERLPLVGARDRQRAFTAIARAVWQVTLVDATLVRYHLDAYDRVLAAHPLIQRELIVPTLAGLRFVRNHLGDEASLAGFVQAGDPGARARRVTAWTWKPVPEPALASLPPRSQAWERARYRAYQAHLAGDLVGQTFGRAAAFLRRAAATATLITEAGADAGR